MTTDTAWRVVGRTGRSASDSVPTEPHHRLGAAGRIHLLAAVVLGAELTYLATVVSRAYFYGDDFIDLYSARTLGPSLNLFEHPVFGHFIPGYNFVNYLMAGVPYHWLPIELFEIACLALTLGALYGLLTWLFGARPTNVLLVALAGASFTLIPSIIWWASGLQQVVSIPACLLAVWEHLRYLRDGRLRHAVGATAAIAVGLAFYDGTLVIAVFLVALTALCAPSARGVRGSVGALVRVWPAWLLYAVPIGLDLGWRFAHHSLYSPPPAPTVGALAEFVGLGWVQSVVPETVFGVVVWSLAGHGQRVAVDLVAQLLVVALVVTSMWRDRKAWRPWVVFALTFLTGAILVGVTRVHVFGPGLAYDPRYWSFDAFFGLLCAGLAFNAPRFGDTWLRRPSGEPATVRSAGHSPRHASGRVVLSRGAWALIVGLSVLAVVAYSGALWFDFRHDVVVQAEASTKAYLANFSRSWQRESAQTRGAWLWDAEVSPVVIGSAFYPDTQDHVVLGSLHPGLPFDAMDGPGFMVTSDGDVAPARFDVLAPPRANSVGTFCIPKHSVQVAVTFQLQEGATPSQRLFAVLRYSRSTGGTLLMNNNPETIPKGSGEVAFGFPPGGAPVPRRGVPAFAVTAGPGVTVCLSTLGVGVPVPV